MPKEWLDGRYPVHPDLGKRLSESGYPGFTGYSGCRLPKEWLDGSYPVHPDSGKDRQNQDTQDLQDTQDVDCRKHGWMVVILTIQIQTKDRQNQDSQDLQDTQDVDCRKHCWMAVILYILFYPDHPDSDKKLWT